MANTTVCGECGHAAHGHEKCRKLVMFGGQEGVCGCPLRDTRSDIWVQNDPDLINVRSLAAGDPRGDRVDCAYKGCKKRWTVQRTIHFDVYRVCQEHAEKLWPGLRMREGDQRLPESNDHPGIQDLVIDDMRRLQNVPALLLDNHHALSIERVITDIEERKKIGVQRYGQLLKPFDGRDSLLDLYQELLDATVYTRKCLFEDPMHPALVTIYRETLFSLLRVKALMRKRDEGESNGR